VQRIDLADSRPSDAAALLATLASDGLGPDDVSREHLDQLYARLRCSRRPQRTPDDLAAAERALAVEGLPCLNDDLIGVIIETRPHPDLAFVVKQVNESLHIPIQLFHSKENREYIFASPLEKLIANNAVYLTQLNCTRIDSSLYNSIFLSTLFWDSLIGRKKILIFQTDALLCKRAPELVDDFMQYDYIGSAWQRDRPFGKIRIDGGNGGLSLRDWRKSMEALKRFTAAEWVGGEDDFFGFHIELIGGRVGSPKDCALFSTHLVFKFKSFGIHKPIWLSRADKLRLLYYCPAAYRFFPKIRESLGWASLKR
jgi:hypothetical protein